MAFFKFLNGGVPSVWYAFDVDMISISIFILVYGGEIIDSGTVTTKPSATCVIDEAEVINFLLGKSVDAGHI